jgi:hypothetical protein
VAKRRDPDCKAIYAWEGAWAEWNEERLTLPQCREIVRLACKAYGLEPPAVKQYCGNVAYSYCAPQGSYIAFVPQHKNKAIVAHEAAHYIHDRTYGLRTEPDHGKRWQGIYFWLLTKLDVAPTVALKASAEAFGLRWRTIRPKRT